MPRAVANDTARRRRERLAELLDALGDVRGARVTQREFAASIGREQGTVAAILGGHRALGGEVLMAIARAYRLPPDYFDAPLRPDPRPYARAALGEAPREPAPRAPQQSAPAIPPAAPAITGIAHAPPPDPAPEFLRAPRRGPEADAALGEVLSSFAPDRAVSIALEALARKGVRHDPDGWVRLLVGAQSAHDHGVLVDWFDRTLAAQAPGGADEPGRAAAIDRSSVEGRATPAGRAR